MERNKQTGKIVFAFGDMVSKIVIDKDNPSPKANDFIRISKGVELIIFKNWK